MCCLKAAMGESFRLVWPSIPGSAWYPPGPLPARPSSSVAPGNSYTNPTPHTTGGSCCLRPPSGAPHLKSQLSGSLQFVLIFVRPLASALHLLPCNPRSGKTEVLMLMPANLSCSGHWAVWLVSSWRTPLNGERLCIASPALLSRKGSHTCSFCPALNEKVLFPGMKTSIQIVAVKPGVVRLGIEAPPDVPILREELHELPPECQLRKALPVGQDGMSDQCLEATSKALGLARLQLQTGQAQEAQATLDRLHNELQLLRRRISDGSNTRKKEVPAKPLRTAAVEDTRHELLACCPR